MISFTCDYNEGAHPEILKRLVDTNMMQEPGYGTDQFTLSAKEKIKTAVGYPEADVILLVGGTQTNSTIIDAMLRRTEGVIAVDTGHIAVHEAGAVEFCGHKVLTLPSHQGKMAADDLRHYMEVFCADESHQHMVQPGMVYISFPTEYGTIYSHSELKALNEVCSQYHLPLFIDGARLGYGLASPAADVDLPTLASLCDVFYIGGTKIGALCGEAVVFPKGNAPAGLFTIVKQHGALLAKGRLLGLQFDTLFTNDLYLTISRHAIDKAMAMKQVFARNGIPFHIDSPTNQQFPILTRQQAEALKGDFLFETWEHLADGRIVTRFATSWATPMEHIEILSRKLSESQQ
ncbi:MAG: amino acid lyase [Prevotella sp.]|nr:amino acid lyase [Prevotella sp.]